MSSEALRVVAILLAAIAASAAEVRAQGRAHSGGTIEIGRLADLGLLDADPLEDIRNTRSIRAVVLNGKHFDRDALDAMLAGVEKTLPKGDRP